jgi:hypothetical protein
MIKRHELTNQMQIKMFECIGHFAMEKNKESNM